MSELTTKSRATDEEIAALLEQVPFLTDRMVVDLVNGVEVSGELIRVNERRQGFFDRAWDAVSGQGRQRQRMIDRNHQASLETTAVWLQNLQAQQLMTDRAVEKVATKLLETREGLKKLAAHQIALRDQVEALSIRFDEALAVVHARHDALRAEVARDGLRQRAMSHMQRVFDAWEAGRYASFSPLTQLAMVLEELYWTPFGVYDRQNPEFRTHLIDKIVIRLKDVTGHSREALAGTQAWFVPIHTERLVHREMIEAVFAVPSAKGGALPLTSTLAKMAAVPDGEPNVAGWLELHRPKGLPFVLSPERLGEKLMLETAQRARD